MSKRWDRYTFLYEFNDEPEPIGILDLNQFSLYRDITQNLPAYDWIMFWIWMDLKHSCHTKTSGRVLIELAELVEHGP